MIWILAIFLAVRIAETWGYLPLLAASYADDLVCLPLILGGILQVHRNLFCRGSQYTLPRLHGLMTLVLIAVYFEALLPRWKESAVADPWDLLMYFAGWLFFELWMNRPAAPIRQESCRGIA